MWMCLSKTYGYAIWEKCGRTCRMKPKKRARELISIVYPEIIFGQRSRTRGRIAKECAVPHHRLKQDERSDY